MSSSELIMDAIGGINDNYIREYDMLKMRSVHKRLIIKRYFIAAACLSIVVLTAVYVLGLQNQAIKHKLTRHDLQKPDFIPEFTHIPESAIPTCEPTDMPTEIPTAATPVTELPAAEAVETKLPQMSETAIPEITEAPEKDWKSEWRYFIANLNSMKGDGVTSNPDRNSIIIVETGSSSSYSDDFFIRKSRWVFQLEHNGYRYTAIKSGLSKEDIGVYLSEMDLNIYEKEIKHYEFKEPVSVYSVNNISMNAALAVCVNPDEYYLLVNSNYKPNSYNEFINDFSLMDNTDFKEMAVFDETGNVNSISEITDDSSLMKLLSENAAYITDSAKVKEYRATINVSMDNDYYSFYDFSFSIYKEGYIYFNVFGNTMCFGLENAEDVINQLINGREN